MIVLESAGNITEKNFISSCLTKICSSSSEHEVIIFKHRVYQ